MGSFLLWYRLQGSISTGSITTPRTELFYWVTIMFSQTLGTALGDWTADEAGFGYAGSTLLFGGMLAAIATLVLISTLRNRQPVRAELDIEQ
ncbi:hypothetical protein [Aeromonas dhakensis]|uniref:hypothetical protein n=1 Tax=Aeromonas dhakensis TaxID=196024 RepID=UPI003B9DDA2A